MLIYPVVHIISPAQCYEQTELAMSCGADGVFLIDHNSFTCDTIIECARHLKQINDMFVGVNFLGVPPQEGYMKLKEADVNVDAVWVDDATSGLGYPLEAQTYLRRLEEQRQEHDQTSIALYGGIAFKYTELYTDGPEEASDQVALLGSYVDVVTTSGTGTGSPPPKDKVAAMKAATSKPLAVASGIDSENISDYNGLVDIVLVSSSLETRKYSGEFVKSKINELIDVTAKLK